MSLLPDTEPGHLSRKARDYEKEIARLRSEGYTLDAIRKALVNAGVVVSLSTVWRESTRSKRRRPVAPSCATQPPRASPVAHRPSQALRAAPGTNSPSDQTLPASVLARRSGKDIAEEFRRRQNTNPLMRAKEQPQ